MKIEIKLTSDHIFYLESKLESITSVSIAEFSSFSKTEKNRNSLLLDCYDKIQAKAKKISQKPSLFDTKKKYTCSLKYHEASVLSSLCCSLKDIEEKGSHYFSCANSIYLLIDKNL